jgi:hypothetical protein
MTSWRSRIRALIQPTDQPVRSARRRTESPFVTAAGWLAGHVWHTAAYRGVRTPWYGARLAVQATVLLILGIPDVVVDAIMGWEPGGAARMRARYMHVTGTLLRKVAQQVGDALWEPPDTARKAD